MDQQDEMINATNTGEPSYDCRVCGKVFLGHRNSGDKEYKLHMKIHAREKPIKCSYCNKGFASDLMLAIHVVVHTKEKAYQCNQCGKAYGQKSNLTKHIKEKHTTIEKRERPSERVKSTTQFFVSPSCAKWDLDAEEHTIKEKNKKKDKSTKILSNKVPHMKVKNELHAPVDNYNFYMDVKMEEQPTEVETQNRVNPRQILSTNMVPHNSIKTEMHSLLEEAPLHQINNFITEDTLVQHQSIHNGENPYQCFTERDHLVQHQQTHTGENPHQCSPMVKTLSFNDF